MVSQPLTTRERRVKCNKLRVLPDLPATMGRRGQAGTGDSGRYNFPIPHAEGDTQSLRLIAMPRPADRPARG